MVYLDVTLLYLTYSMVNAYKVYSAVSYFYNWKYLSIQKYAERQNTFAYTQYIIIIVMRAKQHKRIPLGVRLKMPGLFPL